MILSGEDRKRAINGELSLDALQANYSFEIPQMRTSNDQENHAIQFFRYAEDDSIFEKIEQGNYTLEELGSFKRGVELNKSGTIVECPICPNWIPPPKEGKSLP